jgi:hypothetical protein
MRRVRSFQLKFSVRPLFVKKPSRQVKTYWFTAGRRHEPTSMTFKTNFPLEKMTFSRTGIQFFSKQFLNLALALSVFFARRGHKWNAWKGMQLICRKHFMGTKIERKWMDVRMDGRRLGWRIVVENRQPASLRERVTDSGWKKRVRLKSSIIQFSFVPHSAKLAQTNVFGHPHSEMVSRAQTLTGLLVPLKNWGIFK